MRSEITNDIAEAFNTDLADAVKEFTGTRVIKSVSDWVTGTFGNSEINYSGRGVFSNYSSAEIDGQTIKATDVKLICLQSEVTEEPQEDDDINGYRVDGVSKDPANVTYVVRLRKYG